MFPPIFLASGRPARMAVFSHYNRRANVVTAYFSPAAVQLAAFFNAKPCAKPPSEGIGLLVGDPRCWEIYFPDGKRYPLSLHDALPIYTLSLQTPSDL